MGRYARGGHFGIEVVGCYFGGGNHIAFFARELLFHATVKKECDVCVFLGFGYMTLFDLVLAKVFCQYVTHVLWAEGDGEGVVGLVLRHCGYGDIFWVWEVGFWAAVDVTEELGYFADAVGAVVEEEEGVVVMDAGCGAVDYDGFEEFVVLAFRILLFDGADGVGGGCAVGRCAFHNAFEADFNPVPPFVPVHYVVASHHCGELAYAEFLGFVEELLEVACAGFWICIPAIAKHVDVYFGYFELFCDFEEGEKVLDMGVNSSI